VDSYWLFFLPVVAMVLHGAQSQQCDPLWCNLISAQSLPHDLARLYGRTGLFTSADLGGVAGPRLDMVRIWTDSHGTKSLPATPSRCCKSPLQRNHLPAAKGTFYVPGYFTLIVLMWASCDEGEESHAVKKPAKSFDEQDYREAFMKQGLID
jgi:hypothetical protein